MYPCKGHGVCNSNSIHFQYLLLISREAYVRKMFSKNTSFTKTEKRISLVLIAVAVLIAIGITSLGFIDSSLRIESDKLEISGYRGTSIPLAEIDSIYLTFKRPEAIRISGYQMGYRKIGLFRNKKGDEFSLHIQSRALPWIVIETKDGHTTYFSHARRSNENLYEEIIQLLYDR